MTTKPRRKPSIQRSPARAVSHTSRALEEPSFPFERLSDIAELESWRKEVNRPVTYLHKWWARRLGSVFRAITIGAFAPAGTDVVARFYEPTRLTDAVIFDPFMGSGTTIVEALKLGARSIGRDINPVAHFAARTSLAAYSTPEVVETYRAIEADVAERLRAMYRVTLPGGEVGEVLYFFWVKVVDCPNCERTVDLFSNYVFARHAYPDRYPTAQILCPECGEINTGRYDAERVVCAACRAAFNPQRGPVKGAKATCPACAESFQIAKAVRRTGCPPDHRLYAKLVLHRDDTKLYLRADEADVDAYRAASARLRARHDAFPVVQIEPGYNTDQVLNYGYRHWHEMFNDRQLLGLSILADRIRAVSDKRLCDLFTCLFSGALEFNNMFASYKGEGTGAVRHMFAHHILKPERTPIEANLWGTPKSSGSFSTLFESRVLRALAYRGDPFELRPTRERNKVTGSKVFGLSCKIGGEVTESYTEFAAGAPVYLSCGTSARTDLADGSVDAVITDPPFFDNVNYSQLADFFYVWQRFVGGVDGARTPRSTRSRDEVQTDDPARFVELLAGVWRECRRVLRPDGLLVFTYHHSRPEGWSAVLEALMAAGFRVSAAFPIKAEMSVGVPKTQAKEPIDLDVVLVCRKRHPEDTRAIHSDEVLEDVRRLASDQVGRFNAAGRRLSRNDIRVVVMAQLLRLLSTFPSPPTVNRWLNERVAAVEALIDAIAAGQSVAARGVASVSDQAALPFGS